MKSKQSGSYMKSAFAMFITVMIWACSTISVKVVVNEVGPGMLALLRQIVATLFFILLFIYRKEKFSFRKSFGMIFLNGLAGLVLYQIFSNTGLLYTTATAASVIYGTVPVFTLILETILLKQGVKKELMIATIISFAGVVCVLSSSGGEKGDNVLLGNILIILSSVAWAVSIVITKKLSLDYSNLYINTVQSVQSVFLLIPFVFLDADISMPKSAWLWANIVFLGLVCGGIAFLTNFYAIKRLSATVSALFVNMLPAVSLVLCVVLLNEEIKLMNIIGILLILISLYITRDPS